MKRVFETAECEAVRNFIQFSCSHSGIIVISTLSASLFISLLLLLWFILFLHIFIYLAIWLQVYLFKFSIQYSNVHRTKKHILQRFNTCCAMVCAVWKSLVSDSSTDVVIKSFISSPSAGLSVRVFITSSFTLGLSTAAAGRLTVFQLLVLPRRPCGFMAVLSVVFGGNCLAGSCRTFSVVGCGVTCCRAFWLVGLEDVLRAF